MSSRNAAPALTLMLLAPLFTEVLPGATRLSSMFVFPVEFAVWGGGALLIRFAARRWQLGWVSVGLMAVALSLAEEFLIQQTSLAPMVIKIKGEVYARGLGVNYVYLLWALIYESVFVVFLPITVTELLYPSRKEGLWINRTGVIVVCFAFALGAFLAWFSWTQVARTTVFHLEAYNPPWYWVVSGTAAIILLILLAFHRSVRKNRDQVPRQEPPRRWIVGTAGFFWAVLLYGIVLLGFGIMPAFPPALAVGIALALALAALVFVPRWSASARWDAFHSYSLAFGTLLGAMLVSFIGFIGALPMDLYFKIIVDAIAIALLLRLSRKLRARMSASAEAS